MLYVITFAEMRRRCMSLRSASASAISPALTQPSSRVLKVTCASAASERRHTLSMQGFSMHVYIDTYKLHRKLDAYSVYIGLDTYHTTQICIDVCL